MSLSGNILTVSVDGVSDSADISGTTAACSISFGEASCTGYYQNWSDQTVARIVDSTEHTETYNHVNATIDNVTSVEEYYIYSGSGSILSRPEDITNALNAIANASSLYNPYNIQVSFDIPNVMLSYGGNFAQSSKYRTCCACKRINVF